MLRILIIDDSQMARLLARTALEEEGYEVLEAADGEAGLQLARTHAPDCIFLDLLMPGMQGRDVLQAMRNDLPDVPVIVLTADVQQRTRDECIVLGAKEVLNKPRSGEDLLAAIRLVYPDEPALAPMQYEPQQLDAIKELINIGMGQAAGTLNRMLGSHVQLQVPEVHVVSKKEMPGALGILAPGLVAGVWLPFEGTFSGEIAILFPSDGASKIVSTITGDVPLLKDLDSIRAGTLTEVGNVVLNAVMGTIANILDERLAYSVPEYVEGTLDDVFTSAEQRPHDVYIVARVRFVLEMLLVEGEILLCLEVGSFDTLLDVTDRFAQQYHDPSRN